MRVCISGVLPSAWTATIGLSLALTDARTTHRTRLTVEHVRADGCPPLVGVAE